MAHDLDVHESCALRPQLDHGLDAAHAGLRIDIGMAADGDGAMSAARLDRSARPRDHLLLRDRRRQRAIGRGSADQRAGGIIEQRAGPRLVEMLVHIDQTRQHQLPVHCENLCIALGQRRPDLGDASVATDSDVEKFRRGRAKAQNSSTADHQRTAHVAPINSVLDCPAK